MSSIKILAVFFTHLTFKLKTTLLETCGKVRFYECTNNYDGQLLRTEVHVVKDGVNEIGCILKSRIAGKWCEQEAELERLFALFRKRSEDIQTKNKNKGM